MIPNLHTDGIDLALCLRQSIGRIADSVIPRDRIGIEQDLESMRVPSDTAAYIGLIVNELAANSCVHAYPDGRTGKIEIRLFRNRDSLVLLVADDGVGLPDGFDAECRGGDGMEIVTELIERLRGRIWFVRDGGTTVRMEFPLSVLASG